MDIVQRDKQEEAESSVLQTAKKTYAQAFDNKTFIHGSSVPK